MNELGGMSRWLTVIFAGLANFGIRGSLIILPAEARAPSWVTASLKYVATAILPAMIAPDVLFRNAAPWLLK